MAAVLLYFTLLNSLSVAKFYEIISPRLHGGLWHFFIKYYHISGYDPKVYSMITRWSTEYDVYRHPLFSFFLYPLYWMNKGVMAITGVNGVQIIWAFCQVAMACVTYHFLYRIFRDVIRLSRYDTTLLSLMLFSFAYIQLAFMVPDHFSLSLMLLLMVLYKTGQRLLHGEVMGMGRTALLFLLVAGTTLTNGVKVWLSALFVSGRKFFRPANILVVVILPLLLLGAVSRFADVMFAQPRALDLQKGKKKVVTTVELETPEEKVEQWMDDSTPRVPSLVENMFGESVQFHQDAFLRDISNPKHPREVFVTYSSPWNYVLEAGYIILFLLGLYKGRRERFMLLAVSWFGVELLVHVILGFGLKDVYIMSAHWLFILPLAYGYLLINTSGRLQVIMRVAMSFFTVWLWLYNGSMLLNEFSGKL